MYRNYFLICFVIIAGFGCRTNPSNDLPVNEEVVIDDEKMLLGMVDRSGFQLEGYKHWFDSTYQAYTPKKEIISGLRSKLKDISITGIIASWCSDSQRDLPALYRIIDEVNFDEGRLQLIAVDRSKTKPDSLLAGYGIEFVPVFIFYKGDLELGRIVEIPELSLEEDILNIVLP